MRHNGPQPFEKRDDVQYRLGIIKKQQKKYDESLRCFNSVLESQDAIERSKRHAWASQNPSTLVPAAQARSLATNGTMETILDRLVMYDCKNDPSYGCALYAC